MSTVSQEAIYQMLTKVNSEIDPSSLEPNQALFDFGYDSLDKVGLVLELEAQYSISIPDSDSAKLENIEGIVSYINEKLGK